jgi:hypothetical protein
MSVEPIEARLTHLLAVPMSSSAASRVDARVGIALRDRESRHPRRARRLSISAALVAALLITAGAAAAGTFFSRIADSGPSDYKLAWEQGTDVGVSVETAAGSVTVVRGYADALRVVLAVQGPTDEVVAGGARLTDDTGRQWMANGGPGYVSEVEGAGFLLAFVPDEPLDPGVYTFHLETAADPGRPALTFQLTVKPGEPIRNGTPLPLP